MICSADQEISFYGKFSLSCSYSKDPDFTAKKIHALQLNKFLNPFCHEKCISKLYIRPVGLITILNRREKSEM